MVTLVGSNSSQGGHRHGSHSAGDSADKKEMDESLGKEDAAKGQRGQIPAGGNQYIPVHAIRQAAKRHLHQRTHQHVRREYGANLAIVHLQPLKGEEGQEREPQSHLDGTHHAIERQALDLGFA